MTLFSITTPARCVVTSVSCPAASGYRLAAFGLLPGCIIQVLRHGKSSMVVELRGSFIALSRELADAVSVSCTERDL